MLVMAAEHKSAILGECSKQRAALVLPAFNLIAQQVGDGRKDVQLSHRFLYACGVLETLRIMDYERYPQALLVERILPVSLFVPLRHDVLVMGSCGVVGGQEGLVLVIF